VDTSAFTQYYEKLSNALNLVKNKANLEQLESDISELENQTLDSDIWNNPENATKITQKLSNKKQFYNSINDLENQLRDVDDLYKLASGENDKDVLELIEKTLKQLEEKIDNLTVLTLLSGEWDSSDAIMQFRAGAGGVEACDWVQMLMRMYERYCAAHTFGWKIIDFQKGDEAGVKSATVEIKGEYAYGFLKSEAGTHRLVRLSPFNAQNKRQTSFAGVEVIPLIENSNVVKIDDNDLKIDVYRSSGPGGQSVNTTDSAVRITHIPTGIVVSVQNEKSQLQNKVQALKILESKLVALKIDENEKQKKSLSTDAKASWGDQIRSYTLQPFQLVKDTRTLFQDTDAASVLDGNIDSFIKAYLSADL
jgi:peptide chain release factor 2